MPKLTASDPDQFIIMLLNAVTVFHVHHLNTSGRGSFAQHEALGDLYEAIEGHTDDIAEAYIGLKNRGIGSMTGNCPISDSPLDDVLMLMEFVQNNRKVMGSESFMQNMLDELEGSIAKAIFKLRRLE